MNSNHKRISALAIIFTLTGCGGSGSESSSIANVTCSQFATQGEAQAYFEQHNATELDRDNDNIACEHLPIGLTTAANRQIEQNKETTNFIGDYILLGSICSNKSCKASILNISIKSDQTLTSCARSTMSNICNSDSITTHYITSSKNDTVMFKNGKIVLGSIYDGHIDLIYNDHKYYGQNILHTDTQHPGEYDLDGVMQKSNGHFQLTSYSGRTVRWTDEISVTQNN